MRVELLESYAVVIVIGCDDERDQDGKIDSVG